MPPKARKNRQKPSVKTGPLIGPSNLSGALAGGAMATGIPAAPSRVVSQASRTRETTLKIILSCEHASGRIPKSSLGQAKRLYGRAALDSHIAYDLFALDAARRLARRLRAPLFYGSWSRLCIDLNRSLSSPAVRSALFRSMNPRQQERFAVYHADYRASIKELIEKEIRDSRILHISVHSFTPVLNGMTRSCDVGLLYDPSRKGEKRTSKILADKIRDAGYKVRRNYPYRGTSDGLTTALRKGFSGERYAGIELELNQALGTGCAKVVDLLAEHLKDL